MLSGLFKPAWQNASAEKRIQAIAKMDVGDNDTQSVLIELASNDAERRVRETALDKLTLPGPTYTISQTHVDGNTREYASSVFSKLIGPRSALTEPAFRELVAEHPEAAVHVARLCPYARLRTELLEDCSEPELVEMLSDLEYSETRYQISERLSALENLERARKLLQGKDKKSEKLIRSKLDAIRTQQKQDQENYAVAEGLCEKMEYLSAQSDKEWRPEFNRRHLACISLWEALDFEPAEDLLKRYDHARRIVQPAFDKQQAIEATNLAQEKLAHALETYCEEIAGFSLEEIVGKISVLEEKHTTSVDEWTQLSEISYPKLTIGDKFFVAQQALDSAIALAKSAPSQNESSDNSDTESAEQDSSNTADPTFSIHDIAALNNALQALKWPKNYPDLGAESELSALVQQQNAQRKHAENTKRDQLDKLHKRINRLLGSTNRGQLARAKRELAAISKAAERYDGKDRASLEDRLEKAAEALSKMGDWKDFATEPKYIELCEAMETLIGSKTHADALSKQINELQQSWKALGHSNSANEHWERFKTAGDAAYEPCSRFFKERRDTRQKNLEEREQFVTQTQELLENTNWDAQPDYKSVESELRRLTNDWKKIKDIEPGAGQKQWNRFSAAKDAVYEKLGVVYDANIAVKHQLIEQARALLEADLKEESLNRLQQLQLRWKQVGITRRKDDQLAWADFKKTTDEVYAKVQGVRQSKRDEENAQLDGFRKISRQIQDLAKNSTDLAEADHVFEQLQADYHALPPLPKGLPEKLVEGIAEDFRRACDAYGKAHDRILEDGRAKEIDSLAEKATLCTKLEKLATENASKDEIERVQAEIDDIEINEKTLNQRFSKRLSAALNPDRKDASEARRMLCVDLEILLGVDSPNDDKELRMKVQLERMKTDGIGRGQTEKDTVLNDLKLDWLCLPGAEPVIQSTLNQRFEKLIGKN